MEDTSRTDHEVKTSDAANDDVLSHSDNLLIDVSSSSRLIIDRSSGSGNETSVDQTGTIETEANKSTSEEIEEMPKLTETLEPEKLRKNGKFNLRKSLAWDSAFFTSDGVLDADELTTIIEGGDKRLKNCLPGIEEEVYRSMESISTLESDNLSLDCLEAELFEDIRASIQNSNKLSNLRNSSIKLSSAKKDSQPKVTSTPKKVDLDSGKRLGARTKDNKTSSIPQPKITSRVNLNMNSMSTLTKRASLSANHAKKDQDTAKQAHVTQKGTQTVKTTTKGSTVTGVIAPRRGVLSSKRSSFGTSTAPKTDPTRPSSSCSNSSSCSSGTEVKVKSSANILRKRVDSKTGKLTTTLRIPQTPSRLNTKIKPPSVSSSSNLSSSVSPTSSISGLSLESLSSLTSTITQTSTSRSSIDTSVQSDMSIHHPTDRISNKKGNQPVAVRSSPTGSVSRPPAVQPTGLRMPSPKIGFFDAGKSGARTPNGSVKSQSKLPIGAVKPVATQFSQTSSNGAKFGKIPPPKTSAGATNMKPNPQKLAPKPSPQQQTFKLETKTCPLTSDVSGHMTDPSQNVDDNSNKEVLPIECLVVVKDNKMDKPVTNCSRTPFAVKNSVTDTDGTSMEVTEKTVNFLFIENQQNENSEVV
ncbi:hypothetical protein HanXRQr2_Chr11g0514891 [Helianthus annuus]|uniref:Uncharacterized protein n=1 Tax=Helianthus annuus TaxID=4232 RepID=A0A251TDF0_HELAN|nr:serine-rich adhesin for platelets [Helianthus annuus]KAF5784035.1 hypothetical protein HanXRQr2_Chr11g0514891 [Helianthus annuus]KAJ0503260.1 hypothetical protein HanHA300_Chr11g0422301 [Helianthus annuus]KAJ0511558.1 hypothetical protein HanIR_Chr11g0553441 [Helianthus annuus]KAJ0519233.1 hypothetical protein HanHA89_Chr11g0446501 [Helianthus annuus]KAJ0687224.1 hypothetical protein HanLR1_Chr11g0423711 [Helianthus annuus]